jgi:hypothetical protein
MQTSTNARLFSASCTAMGSLWLRILSAVSGKRFLFLLARSAQTGKNFFGFACRTFGLAAQPSLLL